MSTILKDAELSSAAQPANPQASSDPRSDAAGKPQPVPLEVSVSVNGARTVEGSEKREPFSESTKTVLVFGNGAVIRLQASVAPGQLLFLTNEKTKKEVVCQVVKSKNYRSVSGYVELEFTEAVPGFWGMRFPNDNRVAAPPVSPVAPAAGIPAAPPAAVVSAPAIPQAPKTIPAVRPAEPALPALAPKDSPLASAPAASIRPPAPKPIAAAPAPPAAKVTAPVAPVAPAVPFLGKNDVSVSSTASSSVLSLPSVLTLPRAPEPKSSSAAPISLAPAPVAPAPPTPASVSAPEDPTAALKAENARLQQQLTSLLFAEKKSASAPVADPPVSPKPVAETQAKVVEIPSVKSVASAPITNAIDTPPTDTPAIDAPATHNFAPPVAPPVVPETVKPVIPPPAPFPAKLAPPPASSKAPVKPLDSLLEEEELAVPSWLEPLARNAAISAPAEDASADPSLDIFSHHPQTAEAISHESSTPQVDADGHLSEPAEAHTDDDFSLSVPNFGASLGLQEAATDSAPSSRKLLFIGIAAGVLLAIGGGLWYTGQATPILKALTSSGKTEAQPPAHVSDAPLSNNAANTPAPPVSAPTQPASAAFAATSSAPAGSVRDKAATPAPLAANLVVPGNRNVSAAPAAGVPPVAQPPAPAQKHASLGDVHLAGPTVAHRSDDSSVGEPEPSLSRSTAAELPSSSGFAAASGPAVPVAPIPVGGDVKAAKLVQSIPPVYPTFAKTQHITGDVKIDALIDASGKVTTMKVLSGPVMLHQAAMEALRQWRYQPATLNGNPIAIHLTVTIEFRIQQ
jgi:protein TonB